MCVEEEDVKDKDQEEDVEEEEKDVEEEEDIEEEEDVEKEEQEISSLVPVGSNQSGFYVRMLLCSLIWSHDWSSCLSLSNLRPCFLESKGFKNK